MTLQSFVRTSLHLDRKRRRPRLAELLIGGQALPDSNGHRLIWCSVYFWHIFLSAHTLVQFGIRTSNSNVLRYMEHRARPSTAVSETRSSDWYSKMSSQKSFIRPLSEYNVKIKRFAEYSVVAQAVHWLQYDDTLRQTKLHIISGQLAFKNTIQVACTFHEEWKGRITSSSRSTPVYSCLFCHHL